MKNKIQNFKYSKSSILKYIQCPLSFYFQYYTNYGKLFRNRSERSEQLIVGTNCHEFFDEYNKGHHIADIEEILCKEEVYAKNINGFYSILLYYNLNRALESEAHYYNKDLQLIGYIDALYELNDSTINTIKQEIENSGKKFKQPNGKLAIIDYKTGKYHEYLHRKYIKELNIYVILYEACTGKKIDYVGMFYTSEPDNSFIEPVKKRLLNNDIKDFAKQKQNILDLKFQRKHSILCNYCDFKALCDDYIDSYVKEDKKKIYS